VQVIVVMCKVWGEPHKCVIMATLMCVADQIEVKDEGYIFKGNYSLVPHLKLET